MHSVTDDKMIQSAFCETDFEPSIFLNGTWALPNPSECLQQSVLRLIPGVLLLLGAPLLVCRSRYSSESRGTTEHLSCLVYFKLALSFLLLVNGVLLATAAFSAHLVSSFFHIFFVSHLTLAFALTVLCYRRGVFSSGVLFFYFFVLALSSVAEFRFRIEKYLVQGDADGILFYVTVPFFPIAAVQTVFYCFSDYRWSLLTDDKQTPELKSSILSQLMMSWFTPLISRGYRRPLVSDDVWNLQEAQRSSVLVQRFSSFWESEKHPSEAQRESDSDPLIEEERDKEKSVLLPLYRTFWADVLVIVILSGTYSIVLFLEPYFIGKIVTFVGDASEPAWMGLTWTTGLVISEVAILILYRQYFYRINYLSVNLSSTLISTIYTKALKLANEARRNRTVGEIVNLMSVDVDVFMEFTYDMVTLWTAPLSVIVATLMLYKLLGAAAFVAVAAMCINVVPYTVFYSFKKEKYDDERMKIRDTRVKTTNEVLGGIKAVKMYTWEDSVKKTVNSLRDREIGILRKTAFVTAGLHITYGCIQFFVVGITLAVFVFLDPEHNVVTPHVAFVTISILRNVDSPIIELAFVAGTFVKFMVSNKRVKSFLNEKELDNYVETEPTEEGIISVKNASFYWEKGARMTLRDVTVAVMSGELVAVVGEVGCGKSSLIAALLGEMTKESGSVHVAGSVAYVPQQAWIQNATLKNNVLFGKPLDEKYYDEVIEACALKPDLEMLAAGDMTEIGERGINLSGGQKQRVSLARAVYSQRDVFLLDDPLSAVDAHVGKHLFERVISSETGLLRGKTRILVTHGVHFLKHCDRVIVLKDGQISEQGTYQELITARGAFAEFLEEFVTKAIERRRTTSTSAVSCDEEEEDDEVKEVISDLGAFSPEMKRRFESQLSHVSRTSGEHKAHVVAHETEVLKESDDEDGRLIEEESVEKGQVKLSVYANYIRACGSLMTFLFFLSYVVCGASRFLQSMWLVDWSNDQAASSNGSHVETAFENLGIYVGYVAAEALAHAGECIIVAIGTLHASRVLHKALLNNVIRLPMSFFDTTPLGRIINRFSKDVSVVDEDFPRYLGDATFSVYETIISLIIIVRSSIYTLPLVVVVLFVNVFFMRYYIRASRQIRRLYSTAKSPIYSHFQESLQGAASIRSYGSCERFLLESQKRTDESQSLFYYMRVANQWVTIRLILMGHMIIACAALSAVFIRGTTTMSAGIVGLALLNSVNFYNFLAMALRLMSGVESNAVSIERVEEYSHVPTEAPADSEEEKRPPPEWPRSGAIHIEDLQLRYREGLDLVLRGISVEIRDGEKIGIVGRTGAGKSSLTLALFRIVEADSGRILIDGRDIATLGLRELRSKLTIVPQDPVLFSGSFRMNLDPFGEFDDARLWEALRVASLRDFVESLPERLEHEVAEGGENLSVGQRQLVCLARAVLHRTRILVLDEAAAALDLETDALIQRTIREHFRQCTVLTIAHRLNTVVDNDRLLVLERGQVKEFDSPHNLLADRDSLFHSMAKEAGLV
ncbi:hypothetical protein QR680_008742 [Steinernema hermaphroditum]|uniref:Uncharacterized protein n=1 Tax=Steinernema hermaphroditum TaxID=289476 RepID=A0AA39IHR9_9BILA|nr:hypothetical protein QR680_008742 [Steinernema hermaphroditum]